MSPKTLILCLFILFNCSFALLGPKKKKGGKGKKSRPRPAPAPPPPTPPVIPPLVEVAKEMAYAYTKTSCGLDMERRIGEMETVEPILTDAITKLDDIVDVSGMRIARSHSSFIEIADLLKKASDLAGKFSKGKTDPTLVTMAAKIQAIYDMKAEIADMEGRLAIMQSVAPYLVNATTLLSDIVTPWSPGKRRLAAGHQRHETNKQKALKSHAGRRLKRTTLVDVESKLEYVASLQGKVDDMEGRLDIMKALEPDMATAITTLETITNVSGMGKRREAKDANFREMQFLIQKAKRKLQALRKTMRAWPEVGKKMTVMTSYEPYIEDIEDRLVTVESLYTLADGTIEPTLASVVSQTGMARRLASKRKVKAGTKTPYGSTLSTEMALIYSYYPKIVDMEYRFGLMQELEPMLQSGIDKLLVATNVAGMSTARYGKNRESATSLKHNKAVAVDLAVDMEDIGDELSKVTDMETRLGIMNSTLEPAMISANSMLDTICTFGPV